MVSVGCGDMKLTKKQREALKAKFGGRCAYCGCELGARWCADHVEPVLRKLKTVKTDRGYKLASTNESWRPELDTLENLMPSCGPCNNHKHTFDLEQWRGMIAESLDTLARNYSTYRIAQRFGLVTEARHPVVFWFEREPGAAPAVTDGALIDAIATMVDAPLSPEEFGRIRRLVTIYHTHGDEGIWDAWYVACDGRHFEGKTLRSALEGVLASLPKEPS